jgi:outer membrane protein assembly factor BamB
VLKSPPIANLQNVMGKDKIQLKTLEMNHIKVNLGIVFILLSLPTLVTGQNTGWNNIGGSWEKNGYIDGAGPTSDSVLWETTSSGIFGTPIYIEGNYLVTMRFQSPTYAPVECFDLTTGSLLWSVDVTNSTGRSLPVGLRDNRVIVMRYTESQNDSLYALDVSDGSHIWTSNVNVAAYITESGVFDSIGNFYIYGNLKTYKINPVNGQMIWQTTTVPMASGSGEMSINQDNNTGYTLENINGISYVYAIDLFNGQKKYSHIVAELQPGGNVPQSALMVGNNGVIYVQLTEDNVAALSDDGTQLTLLWQTEIYGNCSFSTMCVGSDGSVYAPSNGKIVRLDPATGSVIDSSVSITQGGFYSPRISATNNNMIYATNAENGVYAFDLSLNMVWSDVLNFTNTSGVCFAANGLAAVSGSNKIRVYTPTFTSGTYEVDDVIARVYPNPASAYLMLELSTEIVGGTFSLKDIKGRVISNGSVSKNTIVPLDGIPQGLYFLQIDGVHQLFKIVKH